MRLILDVRSQELLSKVYPRFASIVEDVLNEMWTETGFIMRVTDARRSISDQKSLYAQGRTRPGIKVTWALPGLSYHNYGLAVDCCFKSNDPYLEKTDLTSRDRAWNKYGEIAESHGLRWGGNFKGGKTDRPHVELANTPTVKQLYSLCQKNRDFDYYTYFENTLNP